MTNFPHYYEDKAEMLAKLLDQMDADKSNDGTMEASRRCRAKLADAIAEFYSAAQGHTLGHNRAERYLQQERAYQKRADGYRGVKLD